jgi:CubicO group peptidase (beta-lactamase class C family)
MSRVAPSQSGPVISHLSRIIMVLLGLLASGAFSPLAAQTFADVSAVVQSGINKGLYPGAVVIIGRRDTVLYSRGFGHLTWQTRSARPSPERTLWDLASLTKVVATTSSVMVLVQDGSVDLDAPVSRYLPRFSATDADPRRAQVTVRMLLDHTSGLPAWRPFVHLARTREAALDLLYATPLVHIPGDTAVYSDLNAMLLGEMVQAVSGNPLDRFAEQMVFGPMGMRQTLFRPPHAIWHDIAPSATYHGRAVAGVPNDGNAVRLGGVAGHAGLFSTGSDLARYARSWLASGHSGADESPFHPEVVSRFLQHTPASGSRLLGWDTPDPLRTEPSVFGTHLSSAAYGHTGWTGTEIWIDPAQNLFLVFLTNRSYAPRGGHSIERLRALRARLSDLIATAPSGGALAVNQGR